MKTTKWKLALLVWSAMFPFSTIISYGLSQLPFMDHWPLAARTFCLTAMLVPYMVFIALPFLTRRFRHWLQTQPEQETEPPASRQPEASTKLMQEQYPQLVVNGAGLQ